MHLDFASALNLVSTITVIGALVFTGLQVRAANRARREQAAVTAIQTAALSENSARILELFGEIPENASAAEIDNLNAEARRQILEFGLRLEIIGYMVSHGMVDLQIVNELGGGAILGFWSRAKEENEPARPSFWNGANGSLLRLLFIVLRARTFQRTSEFELD